MGLMFSDTSCVFCNLVEFWYQPIEVGAISSVHSLSHVWLYDPIKHARLLCPSPIPGACSNSCLSCRWCHPTISSSVAPSPPAFSFSQHQGLFQWVSSSHQVAKVEASASTSVLPMNSQDWFPLGWTGWISLQSKGLSRVFSNSLKASILRHSAFFMVQLSHPYMITGKTIALTVWTFAGKVMFLLFNMLSRLVIAFLPRIKCLNFMAVVTTCHDFGAQKINSVTVSIVSPSICHEVMEMDAMILVFECWILSQLFHSPLSLSARGSSVLLCSVP